MSGFGVLGYFHKCIGFCISLFMGGGVKKNILEDMKKLGIFGGGVSL